MKSTSHLSCEDALTRHTYYRGRVALAQLLRCVGVERGDEVVMQAFTCVANPEAVLAVEARPVYADLAPGSYNAGLAEVAARVTPATRAIIVQHTFGVPAPVEAIVDLAAERGIPVIEDCCHTLEGRVDGVPLGRFGAGAFYSFEWGKPLVAGLGGAALANSEELVQRLDRAHAVLASPGPVRRCKLQAQYWAFRLLYRPRWYWGVRAGFRLLSRFGAAEGNFRDAVAEGPSPDFGWRMAPESARRLRRNMRAIERDTEARIANESRYLAALPNASVPSRNVGRGWSGPLARLPLLVENKSEVLRAARAANVELADWYRTPIHPLGVDDALSIGYEPGSCLEAERRAAEVVSLPLHNAVDERFIVRAASVLGDAVRCQQPITQSGAA